MFKDIVKSKDSVLKSYQNHVSIQEKTVAGKKKALNTIAYLRLASFLVEVGLITIIISYGYHWVIGVLTSVPIFFFLALLKQQATVNRELKYAKALYFVFKNEIELITTGKQHYPNGTQYEDEQHPYTSDLDIYGEGSLFALINRSNTTKGMQLLAGSLNGPSDVTTITLRQHAIVELREKIEETFHFRAGLHNLKPEQFNLIEKTFREDLNRTFAFIKGRAIRVFIKVAPVTSIIMLIAGIKFGGLAWSLLAIVLLINYAVIFFNTKAINMLHSGFNGTSEVLNAISDTVNWTERMKWKSEYIQRLFPGHAHHKTLSERIGKLSGLVKSFDVRLNMFLGPLLNMFFLWDLWCVIKLEKWYASSSAHVIDGISAISRLEELISFATLSYNEPEWCFPAVTEHFTLTAMNLGHPLIDESKRVLNDYTFGEVPTTDIVTGSNMAGKSTFLRTVGINMVLAFSGSVVCAKSMNTSIFNILTYMRIKDSLNDQTSTFKAELNRLRMILNGATVLSEPLVLIDEMLRGTNSKDKYLGSKVFVQQMIKKQTPTLFATHDLQLSEMILTFPEYIRNYHFDIQITDSEMQFDYKLKPGACKTFNAAVLLKEIGLSLDEVN